MSTSLLYHALGLRNHIYEATKYVAGEITFRLRLRREGLRCSVCGSSNVAPRGNVERFFRNVPIGKKATWLHVAIPRVSCSQCGTVRQVRIPFAEARVSYTRAFERYVLECCRSGSLAASNPRSLFPWVARLS